MLNIVLGIAKSQKTTFVFNAILSKVENNEKTILIVPEQATFQNEKEVFDRIPKSSEDVFVTSFSRLSEIVLQQLGAEETKSLDDPAAAIMMSVALDEIADELTIYKKQYLSSSFVSQMLSLADECQNTGVSPEKLSSFSFSQPEGTLRDKTFELSLILDVYQAVISRSFRTQNTTIEKAAKKLLNTPNYFKDCSIYIDDFAGFTAPQLLIIEAMLQQAKQVTVTICSDEENSKSPAFDVANTTVSAMKKIASNTMHSINYKILPQNNRPFASELLAVEKSVRANKLCEDGAKGEKVVATAFLTSYDELVATASKISEIVREQGYRHRDISVVFRGLERYKTLIPSIFDRYEIPYFLDLAQDARSGALCFGLISAIKIAARQGGDLCELAKSPIMGVSIAEAAELECYCYIWSVTSSQQLKPFLNHPDGLKEDMNERTVKRLEGIEKTRKKLADSVLLLRAGMKKQTGNSFAESVMEFIETFSIKSNMLSFANDFSGTQRAEFLEQQSLLWDQIMDILDLFYSLKDEVSLTEKRCSELFELAVSRMKVATVPKALDEVTIGTADRMRSANTKVTFILGAVLGEFPAVLQANGILNDSDRQLLRNDGLVLSDSEYADAHERMLCYRAVSTPTEFLWISYPKTAKTGEVLSPSPLYHFAEDVAEKASFVPLSLLQTKQSALWQLSSMALEKTAERASVLKLCQNIFGEKETRKIEKASEKTRHKIENFKISRKLFGDRIRLSPSKLEKYYNCPFSFFMQSGLKIRAIRKAELSGLEAGTLIHYILEYMVAKYEGKGLLEIERTVLEKEVSIKTQEYLVSRVGDTGQLSQRMKSSFIRIGKWIVELLLQLAVELSQSSFEPVAFELSVKEGGDVPPLTLETADGTEITVEGTVDRVDVATIDGERYVRVIDYKSGQKTFDLSDVYYGLNMQMLLYLFVIEKNGMNELANVFPAGILYQPALGKYHLTARNEKEEKIKAEKAKHYRMSGLILNDADVLKAMEVNGEGIFIPVKEGQTASSSLATLEEMGRISKLVEKRIGDMATLLQMGRIEAVPVFSKKATPCKYCDYKKVCGFEHGDEVRQMLDLDREKILGEVTLDEVDE